MDKRSTRQNRAIHKYFELLADELNSAGWDMKRTLRHDVDIPWNGDTVKQWLWKPIQEAMLGKKSTTQLTTKEIDKVYETLNRHLADKLGVHTPFPSVDEILRGQDDNQANVRG